MASETPKSRPSLKDIARRVSVAPQAPSAATPSARANDTVRPVALSTPPPVPADHPALRELAEICERSIKEAARAKANPQLAPVLSVAPRPRPQQASRWRTVAPIAAGVVIAIVAVGTGALVVTRSHANSTSAPVAAVPAVAALQAPTEQPTAAPYLAATEIPPVSAPTTAQKPGAATRVAEPVKTVSPAPQPSAAALPSAMPTQPAPPASALAASEPVPAEAEPSPSASSQPEDLSSAMAAAVTSGAPPADARKPAESPAAIEDDSLPESPSQGAIQAALSIVRESARSCVVGMDEPSRATVVFGSNGTVSRVAVVGPAAGRSAESCIRTALSGAKVSPFRRASFSVGVTLRP